MKNYLSLRKKAPVITIVRNCQEKAVTKNIEPITTLYNWLQVKYGGFNGKCSSSPSTPQEFAIYARFTVEVLEDYIGEPESNNLIDWYEWLLPFACDEKVLECFVNLWHEYREEVPADY